MPSAEQFRRHFPALSDTVHLASCSHGPLSDSLASALLEYQYTLREFGAPWDRWMAEVDRARQMFAELVNADFDEVAVVPSASHAAYQVASTQDWRTRSRLVTADAEFGSVAQVWLAQRPRGADVHPVADPDGLVDLDSYMSLIDECTGLVSVPLIAYRTGARLPVPAILARARAVGSRTVVDAYQGAGVEPIDVRDLGCDYLITGTLKYLLGVPGLAFLYVRSGIEDAVAPSQTGWFGRSVPYELGTRQLDYPAHARRFESGTPSIPAAYAAVAGLSLIADLDLTQVSSHISALTAQLDDMLRDQGEVLASPADSARRGPMVAVLDDDPMRLCEWLAGHRVVASPRGNLARLSLHYFTNADDLSCAAEAILSYRRDAGPASL